VCPAPPARKRPHWKVCILLTNIGRTSQDKKSTGLDIRELAHMCDLLLHARCYQRKGSDIQGETELFCDPGDDKEHGFHCLAGHVTFATIKGGEAPLDPASLKQAGDDLVAKGFLRCGPMMRALRQTTALMTLDPHSFRGVLVPGGHGVLFDLASCVECGAWLKTFIEPAGPRADVNYKQWRGGVLAAVGHGPAVLLSMKLGSEDKEDPEAGTPWIKDKRITCLSNEEERTLNILGEDLPFWIADRMKDAGANVQTGDVFEPFLVISEPENRLITAQNPESVRLMMRVFLKTLFSADTPWDSTTIEESG